MELVGEQTLQSFDVIKAIAARYKKRNETKILLGLTCMEAHFPYTNHGCSSIHIHILYDTLN